MTQDMSTKTYLTTLRLILNDITARAQRDYGSSSATFLRPCSSKRGKFDRRLIASLLLMLVVGVNTAWSQTYYAIHQSGKGYLRVNGANVNLTNDGTFRYGNIFDDNGSSLWVFTSDGYLKNNYFYLNVANYSTLYLSVDPVTQWTLEDIDGKTKKRIKINNGTADLYLCNDNNTIKLATSPNGYYNACPITLTEDSWSGPTTADLTLQSPQLITYLRGYFTQKFTYSFVNDADEAVSESKKDRRVYATYSYASGGISNKGTDWNINSDGIIYNLKPKDNAVVTANYNVLPADPIALAEHSTASLVNNRKFTIQQKTLSPTANMDYLLFSIKGGDDYRYPYDDGITQDSPVKADGKGGTGNNSVLSDPLNDGSGRNQKISWKITTDEAGFCMFQNTSTGRYLYFYEPKSTSESIGELRVGATTLPTDATLSQYKFRLYKTSTTDYSTCYYIIPYSKLFAIYNNTGIATSLYASLNITDYKSDNTIRLFNSNDNSKWCIYKYEAEYRVRTDFTFSGPASTDATGNVTFTSSDGWYGKFIKESPSTGNGQRGLVVSGTYNTNKINYIWTVIGLDDYIDHTGWTTDDGGYVKTIVNSKTFTFNVSSLPTSTASGTVQLQLRGGENNQSSATNPYKLSGKKTLGFNIIGDGTVVFTDISSLSEITSSGGFYRLKKDVSYTAPGVTTFSGILDCNNKTISGLTAPLFTTLTNGTVCNLNISDVDISQDGRVGAIACTANGNSRIYNVGILQGSVGSTSTSTANSSEGCCGGLVGQLDGYARVINCFSYANITGGNRVGGIVGYNNFKSKSTDIRTMVMNCMFYGDITGGTSKAPVYNGEIISNKDASGLGNYNYFYDGATYVKNRNIDVYNCALAAEKRFLQRFEFYRHLLNSNRKLAAWYVTSNTADADKMLKWVQEPSQIGSDTPFPILKAPKDENGDAVLYPSVVNLDVANAIDISASLVNGNPTEQDRNKGGKMGTLKVNIQMGSGGAIYGPPSGASITTTEKNLVITDKDPDHYNFNYGKVQLPYYNEVGTKNCTGYRVVTGWKIVNFHDGGTAGSFTTGEDAPHYNFADRNCTNKDLYSKSGRVFAQGAYFNVPEGVTEITIEPYWGKAAYLADGYLNVVYNTGHGTAYNVTDMGVQYNNDNNYTICGESQKVYTSLGDAVDGKNNSLFKNVTYTSHKVYDNAVVLVGNYHLVKQSNSMYNSDNKPFTIMSIDEDKDNEPDYSFILQFTSRQNTTPIRFDFINMPGLGMAQKSTEATTMPNIGIFKPNGWFEITNTATIRLGQFEYDRSNKTDAPLILLGGVIDQMVSCNDKDNPLAEHTLYMLLGDNVWFNEFQNGTHQDRNTHTKHTPISVVGGEYGEFHLTGTYRADASSINDNAECYINGGKFGEVTGAGLDGLGTTTEKGDVTWVIDHADIDEFYGGGINYNRPIWGNINTTISNSHIGVFCGGPKFGDMKDGKTVTTTATNCVFNTFYGAGYGGTSYNRYSPNNQTNSVNYVSGNIASGATTWNNWVNANYTHDYKGKINNVTYNAVATNFKYEFIPMSGGMGNNVARIMINYVGFSLATTHNVTSTLTGCVVNNNLYGGGKLGKVAGILETTLTNCTVRGNVFGAGFSATVDPVKVMRTGGFQTEPFYLDQAGVYQDGVYPETDEFIWVHKDAVNNTTTAILDTEDKKELYTTVNLEKSNLGSVAGNVTLTLKGDTKVGTMVTTTNEETNETTTTLKDKTGNVFGGGEQSYVTQSVGKDNKPVANTGNTTVILQGNTTVLGNVFGGGDHGVVQGSATVKIEKETNSSAQTPTTDPEP